MTVTAERAELVVGTAVLAVAAAFLLWSTGALDRGQGGGSYALTASFPNVDGVETGTEIRMAGVRIGRVGAVRLNPKTYFADAELRVPEDIVLPTDSAAIIQSDGLLGGSYIELRPGGAAETLKPGDEIEDVQGSVSLLALMMKFLDSQSGAGKPPDNDAAAGGTP